MKYNKLIRDKIPKIIIEKGGTYKIHAADNKEYSEKLKEKLGEEVKEFIKSEDVNELADILEVFYAILKHKNITRAEIENIRKVKVKKRGAFKKKLILEESERQ